MQANGLPGQLASVGRTGVGQGAEGLALDGAGHLPLLKVAEGVHAHRVLHPLDDLGNRTHIIVLFHTRKIAGQRNRVGSTKFDINIKKALLSFE